MKSSFVNFKAKLQENDVSQNLNFSKVIPQLLLLIFTYYMFYSGLKQTKINYIKYKNKLITKIGGIIKPAKGPPAYEVYQSEFCIFF